MKALLNPTMLIPAIFALALIGIVLSLGDLTKVAGYIATFPRGDAALIFLLVVIYELARCVQWLLFLHGMKVQVGLRRAIFAFVGGEATKSLPAGNYFQNYLLEREKGVAVAYTAAGTTVTILLEVAVCVIYVAIVGISGWAWLRPVVIGGPLLAAIAALVIWKLGLHANPPHWLERRKFFRWAAEQGKNFGKGVRAFISPRLLLFGFGLAVLYLAAAGTQYYIVIRALGVDNVSYRHALSAYLFGLGVGLILPVPTDIGVQELTGLGALRALGVDASKAVAIVLVFRILNLVSAVIVAAGTSLFLRNELGEALSSRRKGGKLPEQLDAAPARSE